MTKNFASIVLAATIFAAPAPAASIQTVNHVAMEPGLEINVQGFCVGEKAAKGLSAAIALGGKDAFAAFIDDPKSKCYYQKNPIAGIVNGKAWEVTDPIGSLFVFWEFRDSAGDIGYTWQNMSVKPKQQKILKTTPRKGREA